MTLLPLGAGEPDVKDADFSRGSRMKMIADHRDAFREGDEMHDAEVEGLCAEVILSGEIRRLSARHRRLLCLWAKAMKGKEFVAHYQVKPGCAKGSGNSGSRARPS